MQPSLLFRIFASKRWQHWETSESWQPLQEKHKMNFLRTASQQTRPLLEKRKTSCKFLRALKAEPLKKNPRSSAGQSAAFWLLCLNQTELPLIQRYEQTPEPYRERSGLKTWKIRNQVGSFPGWSSFLGGTFSLSVPWSHDWIVSDTDGAPQTQSQPWQSFQPPLWHFSSLSSSNAFAFSSLPCFLMSFF